MTKPRRRDASKAMKEFLSEAQELVESLSRNLLDIDAALKGGEPDPEMINEVFRGWHTLKGLASTFGAEPLARLAHEEENLLDDIRLGRVELTAAALDSLLESVETAIGALNAIDASGDAGAADAAVQASRVARPPAEEAADAARAPQPQVDIDLHEIVAPEVLEVLTEFEEHRLKTNLQQGRGVYRVRTRFALQSIDSELEAIKRRLKPLGEIITYLPSTESSDPDVLDIDVILVLHESLDALDAALDGIEAKREQIVPPRAAPRDTSQTLQPRPGRSDEAARGAAEDHPPAADSLPAVPEPKEAALVSKRGGEQDASLRSVSQSVRVDIGKLDRLMNAVGELNIIRTAIAKVSEELRSSTGRRDLAIELHRVTRGFERRLAEMREGILEVRMVPIGQMFDRLTRMTRKISRSLGKEVHLVIAGADTEVDKLIIEELSDPLMHIIRNSIDHGVEEPSERRAAGKPDVGTVALTAYQKGNHVLIEVEDDGAGIDGERVVTAAARRGFLSAEQASSLSAREILNLIFLPGVTTAKEATELSGRGVGMDVVKTNISALGGVVEVQSELGIGTKFTITMPVTLAIIPALLVSVSGDTYAVPLNTVAEALILSPADVQTVLGAEVMTLRGKTLPLCRLDRFFGRPRTEPLPDGSRVVVASLGQRRLGLVVDGLVGQQDVVIKPLGDSLAEAGCFAGATEIGDQRLSLVLDTVAIIEEFFAIGDESSRPASVTG
ncbi:MAG: chemotaxis protein CheA [Proteobacteria bacterium]|jgi:two-component system chemotaxis sensor kinase CheA|nr:chemotaxis protein CheA [Pseudomonadota bacterium]